MAQIFAHGRARPSGVHLTAADAAQAKGMLLRGDRQHDIAAWFGVNGGRIAEIATGLTFRDVGPAPAEDLPPPGPYLTGRAASEALRALEAAKAALAAAESRIRVG
jgi:hypothetical protein